MEVNQLQLRYEMVREKLERSPNLTSLKIHSGMYGVKDSQGQIWRVFRLESCQGFVGGWIAVEFDTDYGSYSDNMPTKKDIMQCLGFE